MLEIRSCRATEHYEESECFRATNASEQAQPERNLICAVPVAETMVGDLVIAIPVPLLYCCEYKIHIHW